MRKLIFIAMFTIMNVASFANPATTVLQDVKNTAIEVVDSTTKAVKDAATTVDTSRLSKQVYGDVKQALVGMASALKVGVEQFTGY